MRRRDMLLGTAALGLSLEAVAADNDQLTPMELDKAVRRLKRQLHTSERGDFTMRHHMRHEAEIAGQPQHVDPIDRLTRSTMRSLLVADLLSSVPKDSIDTPQVKGVATEHGAEMDFAVLGTLKMLNGLDGASRRDMRRALREQPEILDNVAQQIDSLAHEAGISGRKRKRLKELVGHVGWKMRNQGPDHVIEKTLNEQMRVLGLADAKKPDPSLPAASVEHWNRELANLDETFAAMQGIPQPNSSPAPPMNSYESEADRLNRRARKELIAAAICGGVGVAMVGIGGAIADGAGVALLIMGLFPLTGFVVLLIIGLVTLGIAAGRRKRERRMAP